MEDCLYDRFADFTNQHSRKKVLTHDALYASVVAAAVILCVYSFAVHAIIKPPDAMSAVVQMVPYVTQSVLCILLLRTLGSINSSTTTTVSLAIVTASLLASIMMHHYRKDESSLIWAPGLGSLIGVTGFVCFS